MLDFKGFEVFWQRWKKGFDTNLEAKYNRCYYFAENDSAYFGMYIYSKSIKKS